MNISSIACLTFVVIGKFADLNELAWLLATQFADLHITMLEFPVGWRCQVTCESERYPQAHDLVQERIATGVPVQIVNGVAMPTRVYRAEEGQ